jgi:hypothetical protein
LLLAGEDSLEHITGLGDVGEIYLGFGFLRCPGAGPCRARSTLKVAAHTLSLTRLDGTRVSLAFRQAHSFQCIENLFTLDF